MHTNTATLTSGIAFLLVYIALIVFYIATFWKVYAKAGKPGWSILIPIYNWYVYMKIIYRPAWWILLLFIPLVNIIVSIIVAVDTAKVFGKSSIFGIVGLWLCGFVGYPILAFGKAQYVGMQTPPTGTPNQPQQSPTPQQPTTPPATDPQQTPPPQTPPTPPAA